MEKSVYGVSKGAFLGVGVKVWHFVYIGEGVKVGERTKIGSLVHIDYGVEIGSDCKIEGMAYIPPGTVIGNRCFIGPGVVITNTKYPFSTERLGVVIEDDVIICAGAIIGAGIKVKRGSVVGMGAVVTRDVESGVVVYGNPARERYSVADYKEKQGKRF